MGLSTGSRLGPYEIVAPLGAGGMGEVYRARDTRLARDVAVKVLPPTFAADPERLRRFEQEARAVAALNHPNILALYDIGQQDRTPYVVSELLEGDTLRVLPHLPQRKVMEYAVQIAEGLAAAHQKGITHRDLKPENIFVTRDDRVKILDFGLAKLTAAAAAAADSKATAGLETQPGAVLGTVGYMSPEQARGQPADHRSDIFSFGAVLYEMLSRRRAFDRDSAADTFGAILRDDPPEIPVPDALGRILRRCLEKNPEKRFQSAQDLAFALEALSGEAKALPATVPARRRIPAPAAAIAAVLLAVSLAVWRFWPAATTAEWSGIRLGGPDVAMAPRISPDGHTLAFQAMVNGQMQLGVMNVDSGAWNVLTTDRTRGQLFSIAWSPDGARIYFDRFDAVPRGVFSIPPLGGDERLVLEDAMIPEALPDGSLLVVKINAQRAYQLHHYQPATGHMDPLPAVVSNLGPGPAPLLRVFPDGKEAALFGGPLQAGSAGKSQFYALDVATGRLRLLRSQSAITEFGSGLATDPEGRYFATIVRSGDLCRAVAIRRDGRGESTLLSLTSIAANMDLARDGSMYLDQSDHPIEVLRFLAAGGVPDRVAHALNAGALPYPYALFLPDGSVLYTSVIAGKLRVLLGKPGKIAVPLVEGEETSGPMALLNTEEVALVAGSQNEQALAVVSLRDGRIIRRLDATRGLNLTFFLGLAASTDGKTLYYIDSGHLWSVPAIGGQPRRIRPADSVALDPSTGDLVLQLNETRGARFVRFSPATEKEASVPFSSALRPAPTVLSSSAVAKDGRIVVSVSSPDSYFLSAAVIDLRTGKVDRVPLNFSGDIFMPGWTPDGRIVAQGWRLESTLWRFRK